MAKENSDTQGGDQPMSMKERLLAQRRAEAAASEQPARAPTAQPGARPANAPPVPAAKPAAAKAPIPAPAPAPRAAPASAPPPPAPAQRAASVREAAPSAPKPSVLAKKAARAEKPERKEVSADVKREVEMLRKAQDKWLMYGWIVAGVLAVIAGVVFLVVQGQKDKIKRERDEYEASIHNLVDEIMKLDPSNPSQANQIISRAESTREKMPDGHDGWKKTYVEGAGRISGQVSKATSFLAAEKERNELKDGLTAIEAGARDAANKKPDDLLQLRRRVGEYEARAGSMGADFEARVATAKTEINKAYATRLFDEAKSLAAKGPTESHAALVAFTRAEDEIQVQLDDAYSKHNDTLKAFVEPLYQQCITESDKLVESLFTPDVIEKTPWKDVLAIPIADWGNDGLKGFRIENGILQAVGLDPGAKKEGIFSAGDREKWRDFVMEIEFTVKGQATLFWRLGKQTHSAPEPLLVNTLANDGWKAGETNTVKVTYIGSKATREYSANTGIEPFSKTDMTWRSSRKGAFGVQVPEASEIKITKCRIKVLRQSGT